MNAVMVFRESIFSNRNGAALAVRVRDKATRNVKKVIRNTV
jgi:hypothetical protein